MPASPTFVTLKIKFSTYKQKRRGFDNNFQRKFYHLSVFERSNQQSQISE